jgi:hypothetical protein
MRITNEARRDLETWLTFLRKYNGVTIICQPSIVQSTSLNMYTDASDFG